MANDASMKVARTVVVAVGFLLSMSAAAPASATDCINAVFEYGARFDATQLRAVIETKQWQTQNRHVPDELIQWKTIRASDEWATTRECASCSPRRGLTELSLSPDRTDLPCGLKRGMTVNSLLQRLGKPHARRGDDLVYLYPPEDRTHEITLSVQHGRFAGVTWRFYND